MVLLLVLVVVWSFVIYKFFATSVSSADIPTHASVFKNEPVLAKRDSFQLPSLRRDPFLDTYRVSEQPSPKPIYKTPPVKKRIKKPWPAIRYLGYVQGENHQSPLVILSIDNTIVRIRKGEKNHDLFVKKVSQDSVLIKKNNEERFFIKKN